MKISEITKSMRAYSQTLECRQGVFRIGVTADIHKMMQKKNITKTELAKRLQTSKANVTMMLGGDRNLTLDKLFEIYHHLNEKPEIIKKDKSKMIEKTANTMPSKELSKDQEIAKKTTESATYITP